ncbi:hypothetical protein GOV08_03300 [Candidatus Woesearchaeota archaeon]|nr:hypothetical protein [Candidatus Woesearchaeota archaeon]
MTKIKLTKTFFSYLYIVLGAIIVLTSIFSIAQASSLQKVLEQKMIEAKEDARPANIELTIITADCDECSDIVSAKRVIESYFVNITNTKKLDFNSSEAKLLINAYGVDKVPTIIIKGEINKTDIETSLSKIAKRSGDAFVFDKQEPPFIDAKTGDVKGLIQLFQIVKSDCVSCTDLSPFIKQLKDSGLKMKSEQFLEYDGQKAQEIIDKYKITKLPAIILNNEASYYSNIVDQWNQLGTRESDGSFILRRINPPYFDLEENKVKGEVFMTAITDRSCTECYDAVGVHTEIFLRAGVPISDTKEIDVSSSEGKSLLEKYGITKVPMIILDGDLEYYTVLEKAWSQVGTIEEGNYLFRNIELLKLPYKDLETGQVIA